MSAEVISHVDYVKVLNEPTGRPPSWLIESSVGSFDAKPSMTFVVV